MGFLVTGGYIRSKISGTTNYSDGAMETQPCTRKSYKENRWAPTMCLPCRPTVCQALGWILYKHSHSVPSNMSLKIFVLPRRILKFRGDMQLVQVYLISKLLGQGLCHFHPLELNTILSTQELSRCGSRWGKWFFSFIFYLPHIPRFIAVSQICNVFLVHIFVPVVASD